MNEHELARRLTRLEDDPVEPPREFRERLRLMIRNEFSTPIGTGLESEPVDRESSSAKAGSSESRTTAGESRRDRRARRPVWAFAAGFAAVVLAIGSIALLSIFDGEPSIGDADLSEDADGIGLATVFVEPTVVPDGLDLEIAITGYMDGGIWMTFAPTDRASDPDRQELTIGTTMLTPDLPLDRGSILDRLTRAYPDAEVAETTVRGQQAFVVAVDDADTYGWTTAVVVVESRQLASEVTGRDIAPEVVLSVARGLTPTSADDFQAWSAAAIDWDLRLGATTADPDGYSNEIEGLPGIERVRTRPQRLPSIVSLELQRTESESTVTTTSVAGSAGETPEWAGIDALITIEPGVDPESVAAAIVATNATARIEYSPSLRKQLTAAYLERVLSDAEIISQDPTIYQPAASPHAEFDTSNLGTEVPLVPATRSVELSTSTLEDIVEDPFGPRSAQGRESTSLRGPFIHIGSVDDTRLVLAFDGGADYAEKTLESSGWSAGGGSLGYYAYGQTGASFGPEGGHITVRVPLDTAVVLVDAPGGVLWQRPIAGYALIPITTNPEFLSGTITALSDRGSIIDQWQIAQ